jgi:hypothetical protein
MVVKEIGAKVEALPDTLDLSPAAIIAAFPGPALLFAGPGMVVAANEAAKPVVAEIEAGCQAQLGAAVARVYEDGRARADKFLLDEGDSETTLDVTLLPLGEGPRFVLVLSRESTLERNFVNALVSSRQLFKDLVGCSSDFAWETDAAGVLGFVSGHGALGYGVRELFGRAPRTMLVESDGDVAAPYPFETRLPARMSRYGCTTPTANGSGRGACAAM